MNPMLLLKLSLLFFYFFTFVTEILGSRSMHEMLLRPFKTRLSNESTFEPSFLPTAVPSEIPSSRPTNTPTSSQPSKLEISSNPVERDHLLIFCMVLICLSATFIMILSFFRCFSEKREDEEKLSFNHKRLQSDSNVSNSLDESEDTFLGFNLGREAMKLIAFKESLAETGRLSQKPDTNLDKQQMSESLNADNPKPTFWSFRGANAFGYSRPSWLRSDD